MGALTDTEWSRYKLLHGYARAGCRLTVAERAEYDALELRNEPGLAEHRAAEAAAWAEMAVVPQRVAA
jgi:hypothetical protein